MPGEAIRATNLGTFHRQKITKKVKNKTESRTVARDPLVGVTVHSPQCGPVSTVEAPCLGSGGGVP